MKFRLVHSQFNLLWLGITRGVVWVGRVDLLRGLQCQRWVGDRWCRGRCTRLEWPRELGHSSNLRFWAKKSPQKPWINGSDLVLIWIRHRWRRHQLMATLKLITLAKWRELLDHYQLMWSMGLRRMAIAQLRRKTKSRSCQELMLRDGQILKCVTWARVTLHRTIKSSQCSIFTNADHNLLEVQLT